MTNFPYRIRKEKMKKDNCILKNINSHRKIQSNTQKFDGRDLSLDNKGHHQHQKSHRLGHGIFFLKLTRIEQDIYSINTFLAIYPLLL